MPKFKPDGGQERLKLTSTGTLLSAEGWTTKLPYPGGQSWHLTIIQSSIRRCSINKEPCRSCSGGQEPAG